MKAIPLLLSTIWLSIAFSAAVIAQNPAPADLAETTYQSGRDLFAKEKYADAQLQFEESARLWKLIGPDGASASADALHYAARCVLYQGKREEAMEQFKLAYEMRLALDPAKPCDLAESLREMGKLYLSLGEYAHAKEHCEGALAQAIACYGEGSTQEADMMNNLGVALLRLEQYQQAIATQEQALMIRQKALPANHPDLGQSYMNLGEAQKNIGKIKESLFYYEKGLAIFKIEPQKHLKDLAYAYNEIGQCHLANNDYAKASENLERADSIMVVINADTSSAYSYVCAQMAQLQMMQKNFPKAIEWYTKAVDIWRRSFKNPNTQLGSLIINLGFTKISNEDFKLALADFQEAKKIYESVLGPQSNLGAVADMWIGNTYRKWYLKTKEDSLLVKARMHYRLATPIKEGQLLNEHTAAGQRKALSDAVSIFERAISAETLHLALHPEDSPEYAWHLSEAVHGFQLLVDSREANARYFSGIPDADLNRDSTILAQITTLETERQTLLEKGAGLTDSLVLSLSTQIFSRKQELADWRTHLEKNYPRYFNLKYDVNFATLAQTQAFLTPSQTLLEYFVGKFDIFVFVVKHDTSWVVAVPRDSKLPGWVKSFQDGICAYHSAAPGKAPLTYEKSVVQYAEAAQNLYGTLVAPVAGALTPEVIVVPGDGLAGLPFEALLTAAPADLGSFSTYPFLLRNHSFQYAYSATMLQQMSAHEHPAKRQRGLLAFAPFFEKDTASLALRLQREAALRGGFSALPYSGEEVFRAKRRYGGQSEVLTGRAATKQKFLKLAPSYSVLHLATHGKANYQAGDFSFLAFASENETAEGGILTAGELYNLRLQADLVLLSACETARGEQQRGEGVVSLARAFAYAGAKSMVASLWSVNDQSTMLIMDHFHAGIKSGMAKNVALANAKRQYLEKNPGRLSHPFFWAAFVGVGDTAPISP